MAKEKDDIVSKAKTCLEKHEDRESDNIKRAKAAITFRALDQWPEHIKKDRENPHQEGGPRPCPVMDKTNQYVRQVINEERNNRAAIRVRPVDDDADPEVAKIYTGIIRHIEDQSSAIEAYTTAGEHAIDGGFGYFRLVTEYCDPMSFDQDIYIKRIPNRFSVAPGIHIEPDGSDMEECLVWEDMPESEFKAKYPKAKLDSFDANDAWKNKDTIRVGEFMRKEYTHIKIYLLEDGQVVTELPKGAKPIDERDTAIPKIKWYKVTGCEVLEEADMVGSYIPVIKVVGNEMTMPDGRTRLSGAIESMMDPQRLHNFATAGFIESTALAPRAPWLAEESQVEGYEGDYAAANRANIGLLKYKASVDETGQPIPPPQRIPPPGIATGWDRMLGHTEHGIQAAIGMYGASVGAAGQEKSGIALQEQKTQGQIGNFHFPDNLARSIQQCGRILIEWIPKIYDTERVARIIGEDGEQDLVYLNPEQEQPIMSKMNDMQEDIGKIYNLGIGKYDVTVSTGPSYTSKRQEAAQNQMQVIQSRPEMMPIIGDLLFKNFDWPEADKIAERLKTMLPPELKALEDSENGGVDPRMKAMQDQVQQAQQMLEERAAALQQVEAQIQEAARKVQEDQAKTAAMQKEFDADQKVFNAKVNEERAKLQLMGEKLINQIEDIVDPIAKTVSETTQEVETGETNESGEPETVTIHDPAMAEILANLAEITAKSQIQLAEFLDQSLTNITQTINAPRQTMLQTDEAGNPIGSISTPVNQ